MSVRKDVKHVVSTTSPVSLAVGDEWFNPSTNLLHKSLAVNGTSVGFTEVLTTFSKSTFANNVTTTGGSTLVLSTNNNVESGNISIIPGTNGGITINPGTAGLTITQPASIYSSLALTGAGGVTLKDSTTSSNQAGLEITNNGHTNGSVILKRSDGTWMSTWYATSGFYGFLDGEWGNWDIKKVPNGALTVRIGGAEYTVVTTQGGQSVGGDLVVTGNLTVNGTTTTINSTVTTIDDPIITLGGDTSTAEVTKDRGIEAKWNGVAITPTYSATASTTVTGTVANTAGYAAGDIITISGATPADLNGTWKIASVPTGTTFTFTTAIAVTVAAATGTTIKSKNAFFGLDQSTGKFTFIPQANNTTEVFSGTPGTITANDVQIKDYSVNASMWSRSFALMGA